MSRFSYRAFRHDGSQANGEIEASSRDHAILKLQQTGLLVVHVREMGLVELPWLQNRSLQASAADILRFTQQLATLLEAGQPLESCLALQLRQAHKQPLARLLERLLDQVKGGSTLSAAMATEGALFNNFYLSLVRAGEASGMLGQSLAQLAQSLDRRRTLRSELISALIYPVFLVVGVMGSLVLLLTYVVPQFIPIFSDLNVPLPLITQSILTLGEFCAAWGGWLMLLTVTIAITLYVRLRTPVARQALDARLLRIRVIGPLLQGIETARFALTLGTLLTRKVSLLTGLDISAQVAGNLAICAALQQARQDTRDGRSLSAALQQTQLFPELALQMVHVGEQSGSLANMLLKLADIYDKETQTTLKRLMTALVPTLTLVMTVLVAVIMLAIMLPLMSLTSSI